MLQGSTNESTTIRDSSSSNNESKKTAPDLKDQAKEAAVTTDNQCSKTNLKKVEPQLDRENFVMGHF